MAPTKFQAKILNKGQERYTRYQVQHRKYFGAPQTGRVLDFGCGAGGFVLGALQDGLDAWGIEVDEERERQFDNITERNFPQWRDRFYLYPGRLMPYPSNHFDGIYSWFVFEHVPDPQTSLREIARVLKPGGTLHIHAEDVRNLWEGHALAPWPAYMPREFAAAYLEGLGKTDHADFVTNLVVYISAPIIQEILTTLGLEVVYASAAPVRPAIPEGLYVTNDQEARALGMKMRNIAISGPQENLTIIARKPKI
ncbi:class I SAM-dependent methyltransferase [Falsiruegeria mediterranea]|uniref:2-methyl-6-phytyl-1,4-hydroquinone methyltransferase n=1 Tax=Falsiruegeria mediterranea M17 TaxID=1200281 RepID=A0A2R8CGF6_9RHOB|nr:class I SAM-dependent methyltransferase [Falsiruegeria mediterranea]SPJ31338.1 2-methyl-6-phytyl-1,4-hydroquinone methyltransferase [Falsiruegeria mediterranea M17]